MLWLTKITRFIPQNKTKRMALIHSILCILHYLIRIWLYTNKGTQLQVSKNKLIPSETTIFNYIWQLMTKFETNSLQLSEMTFNYFLDYLGKLWQLHYTIFDNYLKLSTILRLYYTFVVNYFYTIICNYLRLPGVPKKSSPKIQKEKNLFQNLTVRPWK